jgi:methionyl aminopeptidase
MRLYTSPAETSKIKEASRIAALVLDEVCAAAKVGISTAQLDSLAADIISRQGASSACLGYPSPKRGVADYPGHICLSINDEVVHGIPGSRILKSGDILSVDVVVEAQGYIGDNARTIAIGTISPDWQRLLTITEESLYLGIAQAKPGNRVGDISAAIQAHVEAAGFAIVRDFVGHGVGATMHEEPQIPNFGKKGTGDLLKAGMVLAIEPMVNMGAWRVKIDGDGWTVRSADGSPSAHFEHTVHITSSGAKILTKNEKKSSKSA